MRITNKVLTNSYLSDLNANLQNMQKLQEQMSSGKEIRRPSDDPFRVSRAMELHSSLTANERYQTNIDEAKGWLDNADGALGLFNDTLQRIRELAVNSGNVANGPNELKAIGDEITELKKHLVDLGNTNYDGRYIFGGDNTTQRPFEMDTSNSELPVEYKGSDNGIVREFSPGVSMDISTTGTKLTNVTVKNSDGTTSLSNLFTLMQKMADDLNSGKSVANNLGEIDAHIDNVLKLRSEAGAKSNRMEAMSNKNEDENLSINELLSKTEDIDIAQKVMEFKMAENVYTASLQTGAKILQPSLLDFLR